MSYVDGFLAAVPEDGKDAFIRFSELAHKVILEAGATSVVDCWADDVPEGKITSMPMAVKCAPGETVALSWIVWPSKEARDAGMAKVMEDPRMDEMPMPFDGKRMIIGGFVPVVGTP
jgi:uncharacterized protein YbaA (DUF1428 family)